MLWTAYSMDQAHLLNKAGRPNYPRPFTNGQLRPPLPHHHSPPLIRQIDPDLRIFQLSYPEPCNRKYFIISGLGTNVFIADIRFVGLGGSDKINVLFDPYDIHDGLNN